MAYNDKFLSPVGGKLPTLWAYETTDTLSEVVSENYFQIANTKLGEGDVVFVRIGDDHGICRVLSDKSSLALASLAGYVDVLTSLNTWVLAGYGGVSQLSDIAMSDISTTWQNIPFSQGTVSVPRFVTYDVDSDALSMDREGVWQANVRVSLTFTDSQAGRELQLRAYNTVTGATGGITSNFFVGRNQNGVNINATFLFEITSDQVGDLIRLEIASSADSFVGVACIGALFEVTHVSEAKGLEVG